MPSLAQAALLLSLAGAAFDESPISEAIPGSCESRDAHFLRARGRYEGADGTLRRYAPPVLWTVPGSGNTMMRQLLEFATGIRSGSVQHDSRLIRAGLLGEGRVDHNVVAVKVHHAAFSTTLPVHLVKRGHGGNVTKTWKGLSVTAAIGVVRDPYNAFFAEYQLMHTDFGTHSARAERANFVGGDFAKDALRFARLWNRTMSEYRDFSKSVCYDRERDLPHLGNRETSRTCRLGIWKFESLISKPERLRALQQIIDFLQLPPGREPPKSRVECAFELSDLAAGKIKRAHDLDGRYVSKKWAFEQAERATDGLVCRFWEYVRQWAQPLGYRPFGGASCPLH
ncbi:hypothetical protein T492DRAFT_1052116 [Pavlovales sp. CCMP2436]|nr:hypothetical protein T492DRAFT_1052116 [Pavlovales sp. CCMP2436]